MVLLAQAKQAAVAAVLAEFCPAASRYLLALHTQSLSAVVVLQTRQMLAEVTAQIRNLVVALFLSWHLAVVTALEAVAQTQAAALVALVVVVVLALLQHLAELELRVKDMQAELAAQMAPTFLLAAAVVAQEPLVVTEQTAAAA